MSSIAPLTEAEVVALVDTWWRVLDTHAPVEEFMVLVADEDVEFRLPEFTLTDKEGVIKWYTRAIHTYFDETHETKDLAITVNPAGDQAEVKILTHWRASVWSPPSATHGPIDFLAGQTWGIRRSSISGKPVVATYHVDSFEPAGATSALPVDDL